MYSESHVRPGQLLSLLAIITLWCLIQAGVATFREAPLLQGDFLDPDSYMRMVRVAELMQHGQWFDGMIARANAPYGDVLHWTRPFDVLILMVALPTSLVVGPEQALYVAGLAVTPLLHLASVLLLIWALRPLIRPTVWFLPALALLLQPGALAYSILGRADHHSLLLLVFVLIAGFMIRALRNPLDARPALLAGVASGFGIWLSVELLLAVALCQIVLGLGWLFGERERAAQSKWYALGLSGVLLAALFAERPFDNLLDPAYDRVSSVQYFLAVSLLLFWRAVETYESRGGAASRFIGRAALSVIGTGVVALLTTVVFPLFFSGPMAEVDPRLAPLWMDRVLEMLPLLPTDRHNLGRFVFYLGGVLLIILPLLKVLVAARGTSRFFALVFVTLACLLFTLAAMKHMRFSGYSEIAFVLGFAVVLDRFLQWSGRIGNDLLRGLLRGSFIGLLLIGPLLVGGTLMIRPAGAGAPATPSAPGCDVRQMAAYLESDPRWAAAPQTVLTFMDIGPELLYRTHHRVVGTPYHRNAEGILDGYQALATADAAAARAVIEQRHVDLVLLCRTSAERAFYAPAGSGENLYLQLDRGTPPEWLAPVALPDGLRDQARLYRVLR
ncbi:hypothetical protein [Pelagibius marinus]|uniref:hypothetical protein n=1 Tax=Pelagibius marinus TaxID=2762760 RepID=UPI001872272C|nr:hypothetical protein [Pelagibius marinus]